MAQTDKVTSNDHDQILPLPPPSPFEVRLAAARHLSKVQWAVQRMCRECGVGFRQLRTCRRTRPGQLCAITGKIAYSIASSARASTAGDNGDARCFRAVS